MDRMRLVLQYFQTNSESISNGICIVLALVSVKLYTSFDFNCPCLPQYNKLYSMGVMVVPPIILFFLGVLVNRHTGVMMDEWMRPTGKRSKNPAVVKFLFSAMLQRALLAPMVWILVTLLDGKIFICAFSMGVDPNTFTGMPNNTGLDVLKLMAKVPCKEDIIFQNSSFRKAVSRYVRCYSQYHLNDFFLKRFPISLVTISQSCPRDLRVKTCPDLTAIGWSILLLLILVGALGRLIKPCFDDHGGAMQTRYWSNYLDVEQKLFDETCVLHARDFARKCVVQFFEGVREEEQEREVLHLPFPYPPFTGYRRVEKEDNDEGGGGGGGRGGGEREREEEEEEERLYGITKEVQVDRMLEKWYACKPELDVTRIAHRSRVCITWQDSRGRCLYSDV
ncbi:Calcium homeostasis modulator protein 3 [Merluccius polli]|uniref:Calcium homeostasis modulator protein 3 n=1 Tax=Merluccius polli TaxID=89951 RepID=A0AA47NMM8_MERPO|nr:Calcium homeostasis modulator protein 3 [Merluccius polli]